MMETILKHKKADIVISSVNSNQTTSEVSALLRDLDKFELEVNNLSLDLSRIDKSISRFRESCDEVAENVVKLGSASLDLFTKGNSSKGKGVLGLAGLAIKGFGYISEQQKKSEAIREYNQHRDEVLQKKILVAEEKLPHITTCYNKFSSSVKVQIEELYNKGFGDSASMNDPLTEKFVSIFRRNFCILIKARFLCSIMKYCIDEMTAWREGKHNSSTPQSSIEYEITYELEDWPSKLGHGNATWDSLMLDAMKMDPSEKCPIPIVFILSDPCLFRSYIGINIGKANNCPNALIDFNNSAEKYNSFVTKNPYYLHCRSIFQNEYKLPARCHGFGLLDLLLLLVLPAALFGILVLIFKIESATIWRIFFMVPAFCWLGLGIEKIEQNFDNFFPYIKRVKTYNRKLQEFEREIINKENCKEFHIIG